MGLAGLFGDSGLLGGFLGRFRSRLAAPTPPLLERAPGVDTRLGQDPNGTCVANSHAYEMGLGCLGWAAWGWAAWAGLLWGWAVWAWLGCLGTVGSLGAAWGHFRSWLAAPTS